MKNVAASLGLRVRSLRRRLSAEGKTYPEVFNEALAIVAKPLLRNDQLTVETIIDVLGFSEKAPLIVPSSTARA